MKINDILQEIQSMLANSSLNKQEFEKINNRILEIKEEINNSISYLTPDNVIKEIRSYFLLPVNYHINNTRKREFVYARQLGMHILINNSNLSLKQIGNNYNKDHATVLHAKKTINNLLEMDRNTINDYSNLMNLLISKYIRR